MIGSLDLAADSIAAEPFSATAWAAALREAGFVDHTVIKGPGGLGPEAPGPRRHGRPEPPRRKPSAPKWLQVIVRAVSLGSGAATLAFLVYQSTDPVMSDKVDMAFGLPGAMLIGMFAIVLVALGLSD
jgi:hypothetical protein